MLDMQARIKHRKSKRSLSYKSKVREAAHNKCSINVRLPKKLTIIFHN